MDQLPSKYQLNDELSVFFPNNGLLKKARVIKVSFTEHSEPLYDVEIPFDFYTWEETLKTGFARIHGLKEWHLRDPENPVADRVPLPK